MRQDLLHRAASGRSLLRGPLSLIGRQQRLGQFELGAGDQRSPDGVGWLNRDQTIGFVPAVWSSCTPGCVAPRETRRIPSP